MKNTIITIVLTLMTLFAFAQKESRLTAYPDQEGNWIVIVDKDQLSAAELRFYDRDERLLAVRRISRKAETSRIKLQTNEHPDSVFRVDLKVQGELVTERELSMALFKPKEHWVASTINE